MSSTFRRDSLPCEMVRKRYTCLEKENDLRKDMFLPELCLPRVCNSSETKHYVNVSVLIKFSQKTSVLP